MKEILRFHTVCTTKQLDKDAKIQRRDPPGFLGSVLMMLIVMVMGLFRKIFFSFHNDFKWKEENFWTCSTGRRYPLWFPWGLTKQPPGWGVRPQDQSPGETLCRPLPTYVHVSIHSDCISPTLKEIGITRSMCKIASRDPTEWEPTRGSWCKDINKGFLLILREEDGDELLVGTNSVGSLYCRSSSI